MTEQPGTPRTPPIRDVTGDDDLAHGLHLVRKHPGWGACDICRADVRRVLREAQQATAARLAASATADRDWPVSSARMAALRAEVEAPR